jgi:hypothetical protein
LAAVFSPGFFRGGLLSRQILSSCMLGDIFVMIICQPCTVTKKKMIVLTRKRGDGYDVAKRFPSYVPMCRASSRGSAYVKLNANGIRIRPRPRVQRASRDFDAPP